MLSPTYQKSKALDDRRVEVEFLLKDPGEYEVWAWPEHETCDQFNHGEGRPCTLPFSLFQPTKRELTFPLSSPHRSPARRHGLSRSPRSYWRRCASASSFSLELSLTHSSSFSAPIDSPSPCTAADDLTDGRWISKAYLNPGHHSPSSPYYAWLESHVRPLPPYSPCRRNH
jgi:hypothetical protein